MEVRQELTLFPSFCSIQKELPNLIRSVPISRETLEDFLLINKVVCAKNQNMIVDIQEAKKRFSIMSYDGVEVYKTACHSCYAKTSCERGKGTHTISHPGGRQ